MAEEINDWEKIEQGSAAPEKFNWKTILNYQSVVRQLPFFLFVTLLMMVYIYNGHYANKTIRAINKSEKELKELEYEYKTIKGKLMMKTKQSEIIKEITPMGFEALTKSQTVIGVLDSTQKK